jgi:hypothetical protein
MQFSLNTSRPLCSYIIAVFEGGSFYNYASEFFKKAYDSVWRPGSEVGIEINVEKSKYMLLSRHQNAGQNTDKNSKQII